MQISSNIYNDHTNFQCISIKSRSNQTVYTIAEVTASNYRWTSSIYRTCHTPIFQTSRVNQEKVDRVNKSGLFGRGYHFNRLRVESPQHPIKIQFGLSLKYTSLSQKAY